ncbi:YjgF-like protein [Panus rudis PR-1116 ss-1]|nr:YjgF-like protein [Panus rudis PR-1116 ss-1]
MSSPSTSIPPTQPIRAHVHTSNPYESLYGYARATRRGPFIFVSGTTAIDPTTGTIPPSILSSAYLQAKAAFGEIVRAVEELGGKREDVCRVRMYVTDGEDFEDVARAMRECFGADEEGEGEGKGAVWPAATGIVGVRFVSPDMKVEIEADAVVLDW